MGGFRIYHSLGIVLVIFSDEDRKGWTQSPLKGWLSEGDWSFRDCYREVSNRFHTIFLRFACESGLEKIPKKYFRMQMVCFFFNGDEFSTVESAKKHFLESLRVDNFNHDHPADLL